MGERKAFSNQTCSAKEKAPRTGGAENQVS